MSAQTILLAVGVILVPLAIAVAVTLWTLEPAAIRNEKAKRSQKRAAERAAAAARDAASQDQSS